LTRKELSDYETYIKELPKEKVNKEIIWVSNDLMEVYETKTMYLYSVNHYLSTILHVGLHDENSKWTISDTKADKKTRTYIIDNTRNMPKTNSDFKQLYLTQNSYDNLNIKGIRTFDVLDKQIRTLKSCLEKGEPMF